MTRTNWPPRASASDFEDGHRAYGSTGQLFEVVNGRWVRVEDKDPGRPVPHHGSGPDDQ
jgi:hypothetical protein